MKIEEILFFTKSHSIKTNSNKSFEILQMYTVFYTKSFIINDSKRHDYYSYNRFKTHKFM